MPDSSSFVLGQTAIVPADAPELLPFLSSAPERRRALDGRFPQANPFLDRFPLCQVPMDVEPSSHRQ